MTKDTPLATLRGMLLAPAGCRVTSVCVMLQLSLLGPSS